MAQNSERTINEMTHLDLNQQPLCNEYPILDIDFELKSDLIHLLPTFRGLAGEDPHKHLKEFHVECSGMRTQGITEEQVKLRAFPFSLGHKAKDWLYSLPLGSIVSWNELKQIFLEKLLPRFTNNKHLGRKLVEYANFPMKVSRVLGEIQTTGGKLPSSSNSGPSVDFQYFYKGLSEANRSLVDAANGGALNEKTPTEAFKLIKPWQLTINNSVVGVTIHHEE
ncbi:UNVERIFIED_CONTAM: hypothetical protein Sradi_0013900 [Sesamum radiatum]|uniref:Retrotransposon gag domain-containing protein n=1 Tax=Sesamum radiatum TaxID=300843 RepID=A0AAW2WHB1_SESRA